MHKSSENEIEVLRFSLGPLILSSKCCSPFLSSSRIPRHQQQSVSIHFPPHLHGLCVPGLTKEKQRQWHILLFPNYTSKNGHISFISYPLRQRDISFSCYSSELVFTFFLLYCNGTHKGRGKRMIQADINVFSPFFPPWIERKRTSEHKHRNDIQFWLVFWLNWDI